MYIKKFLTIFLLFFSLNTYAAEYVVKMLNIGESGPMVFEPDYLKISKGDTVIFEMTDPNHNAILVAGPKGGTNIDTEYAPKTSYTFAVEGLYFYQCTPHTLMGMAGFIEVGNNANKAEVIEAVNKFEEGVVVPNAKGRMLKLIEAN